ncbi:MAG: LTA synthase family protein [Clostridia bacterium]
MKKNKKHNYLPIAAVFFGILITLAAVIYVVSKWVDATYDVDFQTLLYTLMSPLKGTSDSVVGLVVETCLPPVVFCVAMYALIAFVLCQSRVSVSLSLRSDRVKIDLLKWLRRSGAVVCLALLLCACLFCNQVLGISAWWGNKTQTTALYDDYYVDPDSVTITLNGQPKNLIYIYLESAETTYASTQDGGAQEINYIPNMTALANENISFSDKDGLGGFRSLVGTTWTMGGIFSTTSGVPFSFPIERNSMVLYENFASGLTVLGDILENKGYRQEFLCGSDASFGGRRDYFTQHGNYDIFDYFTAIEKGYIASDYYVWWGYEDWILYEIAKDELTRLAAEGQPFNFTFLTADQHYPDGCLCEKCENEYDFRLGNVLACSDRQILEFITWCQQQDFYEDTVIVLSGDHPRMDTTLVENIDYMDRTVYNCFINADRTISLSEKNRDFTSMDMLPTVLYAMGFDIEGERLGLGTNLFSSTPTLAEELGLSYLEEELSKSSLYYIANFT